MYLQLWEDVFESVNNPREKFDNNFDSYTIARAYMDLEGVRSSNKFERLIDEVYPRKGF